MYLPWICFALGMLGFVPPVIFSFSSAPHFAISADGAIACLMWSCIWCVAAGAGFKAQEGQS